MRLAIIVSHPIQYYSPWFRHLAEAFDCTPDGGCPTTSEKVAPQSESCVAPPAIRATGLGSRRVVGDAGKKALRVFYLWDFGVEEKTDRGFGKAVKWDVDLLGGYDHEFVPNISRDPGTHWFGGLDNPELLRRVKAFAPDAVLQFGYNYKTLIGFDLRWNTRRSPLLFRGDSHLLAESERSIIGHGAFGARCKRWVRQAALRLLLKRFASFLAVGKANADYFRAHGVPETKIVSCPHAVDNEFFLREPQDTHGPGDKIASPQDSASSSRGQTQRPKSSQMRGLRGKLGIPADELVFLFAGKLEEKKQPMALFEAFRVANLRNATLLFVGSGELESELRNRLAVDEWAERGEDCFDKGNKRVVLLPFQNQSRMPDVYRTGDVLVLPSGGRYETWGLAVNEAACCGLPAIVSSHVGCGPDLIRDGETGWTFDSGSIDALASALEKADAEKSRLVETGARLRDLVTRQFSYEVATTALRRALRNLCSKSNRRAQPK